MGSDSRVIGYVRVSTQEQGAHGLGMEAQRDAITLECQRRGWRLVGIESDISSGARADRPGLKKAVQAIEAGEVDGLIVAKLDRLSRSVVQFSQLLERFRAKGWGLVILDLGIDTTTIMGEAMATMAATFAQVERRRIGERTREALAVAKSQGVTLGRPRTLPEKLRKRIRREHEKGLSLSEIARRLNAEGVATAHGGQRWHPATIKKIIEGS